MMTTKNDVTFMESNNYLKKKKKNPHMVESSARLDPCEQTWSRAQLGHDIPTVDSSRMGSSKRDELSRKTWPTSSWANNNSIHINPKN